MTLLRCGWLSLITSGWPCWSSVASGGDWFWLPQGLFLLRPGVVAERILGVCHQHLDLELFELFVWSGGSFSTATYKVVQCPNVPLSLSL